MLPISGTEKEEISKLAVARLKAQQKIDALNWMNTPQTQEAKEAAAIGMALAEAELQRAADGLRKAQTGENNDN